ncbi:DUF2173 family protein [Gammaproteobacteria bacterium]
MSLITQLLSIPGVIAAGEFSHRGERFTHAGLLDSQQARMASIMCSANSLAIHMQAGILGALVGEGGITPAQGWIVRGSHFTVCVIGQRFCFLEQETASLNQVVTLMKSTGTETSTEGSFLGYK